MRYLGEDEATQMMGIGYCIKELDGNLYDGLQGVDEWGEP